MSVNGKLILAVKMLLERGQYKADLNQAVADTQDAAQRIEGSTRGVADAVQDAVGGQSAAVNAASRAFSILGPAGAAAAAVAIAVGAAYHQAHQETLGYEKAIILSGNAAAVTSGQLADMARSIDGVAGTQANAAKALETMTASGEIARENLEKVSLAAIEMERATGQSISDTEKLFSSLGDAPVKASLRLNESLHYLTAATYAQIKAADDLGDKETAASLAQNALADAMRGRAAQVEQHLGILERGWRGVRDLAKEAWDAMVGMGRPDTLAQQRERADNQVAFLQKQIDGRKGRGLATGDLDGQLAAAQQLQETLRETAKLDEKAAGTKRELAAQDAARIELAQALEQSASKQVKMAQAVAQANALADRAGASAAEREQLVNAAREKYAEKAGKAKQAGQSEEEREAAAIANLSGLTSDYQQKLTELQSARAKNNISEERYIELLEALIARQPMAKQLIDAQTKATSAAEKATLELAKARDKDLASTQAAIEKARAAVTAQEEQNARLGMTKEAVADLDAAKLEMLATDLELQAIQQMDKNLDEQRYELLKQQAQAYRDLAKAKREGAAKQAGLDAEAELTRSAEKAAAEGQRAAERIEQTLTDSLMRGFEAGKDAAENLADTVVNMFKTMVLRPTISAFMSPIAGAIQGALGGGSAGSSLLSNAGTSVLGNMLGGVGAFGVGASYGATSLFANGLSATLSAGSSMIGAGSVASGLGTIAGALGPIALGVGAVYSLVKSLDDSGTMHTGSLSQYSGKGGLQNSTTHGAFGMGFGGVDYSASTEQFTGALATSIVQMLDSTATAFGREAGYKAATAFADDSSDDAAWGGLLISKLEETIVNWDASRTSKWAPREFSDGEAGKTEYLAAVAKDLRAELMTVVDDWAKPMIEALGSGASLEELAGAVEQINAAKAAFVAFAQYMPEFANLAGSTIGKLAEASGGAGALAANMASFVSGFYTEGERLAVARENLTAEFDKLGLAVPRTREEYRDLVRAQIELGDAGAATAATLLQLSGAFLEINGAAGEAAQNLGITADSLKDILETAVRDSSSPADASNRASAAFEEQVYAGMFSALTGGISEMLMGSIVGPLVSSLATGAATASATLASGSAVAAAGLASGAVAGGIASAQGGGMAANAMAQGGAAAAAAMAQGGAVAGAAVQSAIAQAHASISAYAAIMSDPSIQDAIKGVSGAIGSVAGDLKQRAGLFVTDAGFSIGAATGLSSAMGQAADSMKDLTDAIIEEVKRIRGVVEEGNPAAMSYSAAQSQFAVATAAARAGDKKAAEALPELSRKMLEMAERNERSTADLRYVQAATAASLQATAEALVKKYGGKLNLPKFDVGINEVPYDMVAQVHQGERILPAADNRELKAALSRGTSGGDESLLALVTAIERGFDSLGGALSLIEQHTEDTKDKLAKWERTGLGVRNQPNTTFKTVAA